MRFVALVAIAVALAVPAWAAGEREVEYVTLTFYGLDSRSKTLVDKAPLGDTPSKGDVIRLTLRLINSGSQFGKASGARVGSAVQTYTFTSRRKATVTQLATLPTGTIRTGGIADTQGFQQTWRVVGGTRTFAKAGGTFDMTPIPNGSQGQAYYLRLP